MMPAIATPLPATAASPIPAPTAPQSGADATAPFALLVTELTVLPPVQDVEAIDDGAAVPIAPEPAEDEVPAPAETVSAQPIQAGDAPALQAILAALANSFVAAPPVPVRSEPPSAPVATTSGPAPAPAVRGAAPQPAGVQAAAPGEQRAVLDLLAAVQPAAKDMGDTPAPAAPATPIVQSAADPASPIVPPAAATLAAPAPTGPKPRTVKAADAAGPAIAGPRNDTDKPAPTIGKDSSVSKVATDERAPDAALIQAPDAVRTDVAASLGSSTPAPHHPSGSQPGDVGGTAPIAEAVIRQHLDVAHDGAWLDRLARDIAASAAPDGKLHFQLNPEHLGALKVELANGSDGTSIRMTTDSEAARSLLSDAQPRLIAEARAQGMRIADAQVDLGGQGSAGSSGSQQRPVPEAIPLVVTNATGSVERAAEAAVSDERYA